MKTERFSLASATDVAVFDTLVKVIRFDEGNAGGLPVIIKVKSLSGGAYEVELKPGRQITLPEVTRGVVISNLSGGALSGKITIGAGQIEDNSVVGSVEVIDGGKARSIAGSAFMGGTSAVAVGGQYPHVQIFNPAGSGKNVYIESFVGSGAAAGFANFRPYSVAFGGGAVAPSSKLIGGAIASVCELRATNNIAVLGTGPLIGGYFAAGGQFPWKLAEPICLQPGKGALLQGALGADLAGYFEFFEETI